MKNSTHKKLIANFIFTDEILKIFPLQSRKYQKCPLPLLLLDIKAQGYPVQSEVKCVKGTRTCSEHENLYSCSERRGHMVFLICCQCLHKVH